MAITEKYVSSLAGGSGNGLTAGTAYTFSQMVTEINAGIVGPGIRYNIKADGTYSRGGGNNDNMGGGNGTTVSPIILRGYKTTIGDGYLGRSGTYGNGPLITTNMPLIDYSAGYSMYPGQRMIMESLSFTGSNGGDAIFQVGRDSWVIGCTCVNSATGTDPRALKVNEYCTVFECDLTLSATSGPTKPVLEITAGFSKVDSCRIISMCPTAIGIQVEFSATVYGCLIKGANGGSGVITTDSGRGLYLRNNTIVGWQDGALINQAMERISMFIGNMITDNTRWGINQPAASGMCVLGPNRMRDNVSGDINNSTHDWTNAGRIFSLVTTDTGGPETDYTNAATNDYSLIPASPGKGINRPRISDMGPYGLSDPSGGGGTAIFNPLATTIIESVP